MSLVSRSMSFVIIMGTAACVFPFSVPAHAQDASVEASSHDGSLPRTIKRSGHRSKTAKTAAKPVAKEPEPWEAVDPGRASGEAANRSDPGAAAVPGVRHVVQPDEDRISYGMKWTTSNAPNVVDGTQGVINEINHDMGAPNAVGTDAEAGVKLKF